MADKILETLRPIVGKEKFELVAHETLEFQHQDASGDATIPVQRAVEKLKAEDRISSALSDRLTLAVIVAGLSDNNAALVRAVDEDPAVNDLGAFALRFDTKTIQQAIASNATAHNGEEGAGSLEAAATEIRTAAFRASPTATVQGMVMNDKVKLSSGDVHVKAGLVTALAEMGVEDIVSKPVTTLASVAPIAAETMPPERQAAVVHEIKALSRVASIAPTTKAMQGLVNQGLTTSLAIANVPRESFVSSMAEHMEAADASAVHANAVGATVRNQNLLVELLQAVRGTGLQAIDGRESAAFQKLKMKELKSAKSYDLNFETLFGSMDQAVSAECATVYSPASYLVDLLQYLRSATLEPSTPAADPSPTGTTPSIKGTVLEKLFRRRPDLGNLQLTCENTNTVLPYIDLGNEVMESFIRSLDTAAFSQAGDAGTQGAAPSSRQLAIDAYNVVDQDSSELVAQPQNTDYDSYEKLARTLYPLSLPYNQPLDRQRALFDFLKLSRHGLLDRFRPKPPNLNLAVHGSKTTEQLALLDAQLSRAHAVVLERQLDAETLGLSQAEYLALTGELYFGREYFEATEGTMLDQQAYRRRVELPPVHACWGYKSPESLSSTDEVNRTGLRFVKQQFLPRSGASFSDLVDMVQTGFVNPHQLQGKDKAILEEISFSYQFLQTLIVSGVAEPEKRYERVAEVLVGTIGKLLPQAEESLETPSTGGAGQQQEEASAQTNTDASQPRSPEDIRKWVYDHFERVGKLIVLDSGEGPRLSFHGELWSVEVLIRATRETKVGNISSDGTITDDAGTTIGTVNMAGRVLMGNPADEVTINQMYSGRLIKLMINGQKAADVSNGYFTSFTEAGADVGATGVWQLTAGMGGSGNIDNVRLRHLDGTLLSTQDWDRMHKFTRIWRRLGWSIQETDMALGGVLNSKLMNEASEPDIDAETLHGLAAIKQLLPMTGLSAEQVLTFWADMPTRGPQSLYRRLFFGTLIKSSDPVFGPDANGDYFETSSYRISDYPLIVLAAFGMRAADMDYLLGRDVGGATPLATPIPDFLSVANLSAIYRHVMLARILGVAVTELGQVLAGGFSDPFSSPSNCLGLLQTWTEMSNAGFTWQELRYLAARDMSTLGPLVPDAKLIILQTAKTLHDGFDTIRQDHRAVKDGDEVPIDLVKAKAGLIFEEGVVMDILQLLNGETGKSLTPILCLSSGNLKLTIAMQT